MWPDTRVSNLFNIKHPIILSPMAGSAGPELASAVSIAGGLGSLPCASLSGEEIRKHVDHVRQNTSNAFSLNFFCHEYREYNEKHEQRWLDQFAPFYSDVGGRPSLNAESSNLQPFGEEHCLLIEELKPAVASFHFGLPKPELVSRVKNAGCQVISSANTVAEAVWLEGNGCDAVIAQGTEAGGHRAMFQSNTISEQCGTMALVPQIVDAINIPVIAAGGIGDGRGIAAAIALGASAVQIGTAYLFADESWANDLYRKRLLSSADTGTVITNVFSGRPARGFENRLTQGLGPMNKNPMVFPMGYGVLAPFKKKAESEGSTEFSSYLAGQAAKLGSPGSAADITQRLIDETKKQLLRLSPK